jgi:glycosyltransferase involved in cell wall biosynthesis
MDFDRPLLTFAIPTHNRAEYLEGLLEFLVEELRDEHRVEVLVSDNASSDRTGTLVSSCQTRGLAVRYIRNPENIGPDGNILQCFMEAAGKYVWVFSDDDLLRSGSFDRILNLLCREQYSLICVRAYFFEGEYQRHKEFTPVSDLICGNAEDLARHFHVFFTFISGVILNKDLVSSSDHRPFESLLGSNLAQLGPVYTALNHHRISLLIRDPLIAARGNSTVGYAMYRIFGPSLHRITTEWIEKRSVQRAIINGTIQMFFPFFLLRAREAQISTVQEDPHEVLRTCHGKNLRYWVFNYPIYALPIPFAKIWLLIIRMMNKADALLGGPIVRS